MNGTLSRRRHRSFGLATATVGLLAVALAVSAPPDAVQGHAQRLMYLHVPAAWAAYLSFSIVLAASIAYLIGFRTRAAMIARAAAETGLVATGLTLASGMLWGALTWGTAWVWDARTTSTLAMGLVYVVYLCARLVESGRKSRIAAAWVGVAGFVSVPVVHLSVLWWRTLHQPATLLAPSTSPPIHPAMGAALIAAALAASMCCLWVIRLRVRRLSVVRREPAAAGLVASPPPIGHGRPR